MNKELYELCQGCNDCPSPVFGDGCNNPKIMVVADYPNVYDSLNGEVFTGKARTLTEQLMIEVGLDPSNMYFTYAVKCRPPGVDKPGKAYIKNCRNLLKKEIAIIKPDVVFLLGNISLETLLGRSGITKYRGKIFKAAVQDKEIKIVATIHPSSVHRSPQNYEMLKADIILLSNILQGSEIASEDKLDYTVIQTYDELLQSIQEIKQFDHLAYDLETEGFDYWDPSKVILTLSITLPNLKTFVYPIQHGCSPWRTNPQPVFDMLKPIFEDKYTKIIGHNIKFDNKWLLAHYGIVVNNIGDTMLMSYILNENTPNGLKHIARLYFGAKSYDDGIEFTKEFDLARMCKYNGLDTYYTMQAYHLFKNQLMKEPSSARIYTKLLIPGSFAFTHIESHGLYIDRKLLKERKQIAKKNLQDTYQKILESITEEFNEENKVKNKFRDFNPNSTKQLGLLLFSPEPVGLGLPIIEHTEKGAPSTAESTLIRLQDYTTHPIMGLIMEYRKWSKYLSTYLEPWDEKTRLDSRLRASYLLHGTVTGRLSAKDGVHQTPRDPFIRGLISAPPGWTFVEADYSQMELRIASEEADEDNMKEVFKQGQDIHRKTAASTTGKNPKDVTKEERKAAKATNFGFLYGMWYKKFKDYAKEKYGVELTMEQAKAFRDKFFETYPGLLKWHERQRKKVKQYGYVESLIGRRRRLPEINSGDESLRAAAEREAINSPVQSLGSDVGLSALIDMFFKWTYNDPNIFITASVHDAIIFEIKNEVLFEYMERIKLAMEDMTRMAEWFGLEFTVPIEVEVEYGTHWENTTIYEKKDISTKSDMCIMDN